MHKDSFDFVYNAEDDCFLTSSLKKYVFYNYLINNILYLFAHPDFG